MELIPFGVGTTVGGGMNYPLSVFGRWVMAVGGEWPVLFLWPLALALAYVFPDGRLPAGRLRLLTALAAVSATGVVMLLFLAPELDGPYGQVPTPLPFVLDEETFLAIFWACA